MRQSPRHVSAPCQIMVCGTASLVSLAIGFLAMASMVSDAVAQENTAEAVPTAAGDAGKVTESQAPGDRSILEKMEQDIDKALSQRMDFHYDELPFSDVTSILARTLAINVVVTQSALDDQLSEDELISSHLTDLPVSLGLRLLLRPYNATYAVCDGVVKIISLDNVNDPEFQTRRMFPVSILLETIEANEPDRIGQPAGGAFPGGMSGGCIIGSGGIGGGGGLGGGGLGGGGGVFAVPSTPQNFGGTSSDADQSEGDAGASEGSGGGNLQSFRQMLPKVTARDLLIDAIMTTVQSDTWMEYGTGNATLDCLGGVLIVNAPASVCDDVKEFLHRLEATME